MSSSKVEGVEGGMGDMSLVRSAKEGRVVRTDKKATTMPTIMTTAMMIVSCGSIRIFGYGPPTRSTEMTPFLLLHQFDACRAALDVFAFQTEALVFDSIL